MPAPDLLRCMVAPLDTTGVRYMLTGGVAAIIYGEPRLTIDVDVVLEYDAAGAGRISVVYDPSAYYVPPIEVLIEEGARPVGGHFNLIHLESSLRADCYVAGIEPLIAWGLANRHAVEVDGQRYFVAPVEYVIVKKLEYYHDGGSARHLADIRHMLRLSATDIDRTLIDSWVDRLGLGAAWSRASDGSW